MSRAVGNDGQKLSTYLDHRLNLLVDQGYFLHDVLTFRPEEGPLLLRMGNSTETKEMVKLVMELDRIPERHQDDQPRITIL